MSEIIQGQYLVPLGAEGLFLHLCLFVLEADGHRDVHIWDGSGVRGEQGARLNYSDVNQRS